MIEVEGKFQSVHHPDWSRGASIYEVNLRQFTPEGTLRAKRHGRVR